MIETIPYGLTFVSTSAANYTIQGNICTFTQVGSVPITYTLRAPPINGSFAISGTFKNELMNTGTVSGTTRFRVGGTNYDSNGNGRVDRNEAVAAVMDYFGGALTREEAIGAVMAYFNG